MDFFRGLTSKFRKETFETEWKTPRERPTSGPGSEHDDGEELGDDDYSFPLSFPLI